ncbi:hypothetical protein A0H81_01458 [Grifola frondosa]|uniref:Uncharacterized protein n=1 Tax=Grifola frondosa TaxID=5627 RepID=A0A1C7MSW0_GRIFR|nr:hypothetical protein A0H81_01458 [Grifola frondosa]
MRPPTCIRPLAVAAIPARVRPSPACHLRNLRPPASTSRSPSLSAHHRRTLAVAVRPPSPPSAPVCVHLPLAVAARSRSRCARPPTSARSLSPPSMPVRVHLPLAVAVRPPTCICPLAVAARSRLLCARPPASARSLSRRPCASTSPSPSLSARCCCGPAISIIRARACPPPLAVVARSQLLCAPTRIRPLAVAAIHARARPPPPRRRCAVAVAVRPPTYIRPLAVAAIHARARPPPPRRRRAPAHLHLPAHRRRVPAAAMCLPSPPLLPPTHCRRAPAIAAILVSAAARQSSICSLPRYNVYNTKLICDISVCPWALLIS